MNFVIKELIAQYKLENILPALIVDYRSTTGGISESLLRDIYYLDPSNRQNGHRELVLGLIE
jgi:hypothetical protein